MHSFSTLRRLCTWAAIGFASAAVAQASSDEGLNTSAETQLIIFRPNFSPPLAFKPMIRVNGKPIARLPRNQHIVLSVKPGRFEVQANWGEWHGVNDSAAKIEIARGETSFVRITNRMNLPIPSATYSSLDSVEAPELSTSIQIRRVFPGWYIDNESIPDALQVDYSDRVSWFIAQLSGGIPSQQIRTAKSITNEQLFSDAILSTLEMQLRHASDEPLSTRIELEAAAWMCRALANSADPRYLPFLKDLGNEAANKKLRKYAKRYVRKYY